MKDVELTVCPDCAVIPGHPHEDGCDVAWCLWTGIQRLSCDGSFADIVHQLRIDRHGEMADRLAYHLSIEDEDYECGADVWTGRWPGKDDAARLGWWSYHDRYSGWVRCEKDHPKAGPDLNRLATEGIWNRERQRWEGPDEV